MKWFISLATLLTLAALFGSPAARAQTGDLVLDSIPDGPVAIVHGRAVDPIDFRDLYMGEIARFQGQSGPGQPVTDEIRIGIAMAALRSLVEQQLLAEEADRRNLKVTAEEKEKAWASEVEKLSQAIARSRDTGGEAPTEAEVLEMAGATREEALDEIERVIRIEKARDAVVKDAGVTVSSAEIQKFFDENIKDKGPLPEKLHLKQMFFAYQKGMDPAERQQVKEKANKAATSVLSGQSFESVAKKMSEGRFKDNGGDWGPLPAAALPDFVVEAARALKPGEMSGIIESEYGCHIVKMVEVIPGETVTVEKATPTIKRLLMDGKSVDALRKWTAKQTNEGEDVSIFLDIERQVMARPELRDRLMEAMPLPSEADTNGNS